MELFDSVHGTIQLCPMAKKIVDTPEYQRLRNIKQLGMVYHVFPSASHNRFEHSLGVYHLSKLYMDILNKKGDYFDDKHYKLISIASLIHDLGHGPFSHLFDVWQDHNNHEFRSIEIFKYMNTKYGLGFTKEDLLFMYNTIDPKFVVDDRKYLYQILSNSSGIDVDRMDYIMRDTKMTGINYGIESEKIMRNTVIDSNEIKYKLKGKIAINDFLNTRFILYREIYNHKTVVALEYHIKEILDVMDKDFDLSRKVKLQDWKNFVLMDDNILNIVQYCSFFNCSSKVNIILNDIKTRNIYKMIGEILTDKPITIKSEKEDVIVSQVRLKYYSSELPKYVDESSIKILKKDNGHCDEYITRIYCKDKEDVYANNLFKSFT